MIKGFFTKLNKGIKKVYTYLIMQINRERMTRFCIYKIGYIVLYSIPIIVTIYFLDYKFDNHVLNAILLFYIAYAFKSALFITAAPFSLLSELSAEKSESEDIIYQNHLSMIENYPIINKINNIIMTIYSILLVSSFIYFSIGLTIEGIKLSGKG